MVGDSGSSFLRPSKKPGARRGLRTATRLSWCRVVEVVVGLGNALTEPPHRVLGDPLLERIEHVLGR